MGQGLFFEKKMMGQTFLKKKLIGQGLFQAVGKCGAETFLAKKMRSRDFFGKRNERAKFF